MMVIPRAEQLRIIQRVHAKWSEIYDDRDDFEANAVHFQMVEEAMAGAEDKQKCQPPYG
jgi:thioesterase domain-containing protein